MHAAKISLALVLGLSFSNNVFSMELAQLQDNYINQHNHTPFVDDLVQPLNNLIDIVTNTMDNLIMTSKQAAANFDQSSSNSDEIKIVFNATMDNLPQHMTRYKNALDRLPDNLKIYIDFNVKKTVLELLNNQRYTTIGQMLDAFKQMAHRIRTILVEKKSDHSKYLNSTLERILVTWQ